MTRERITLGLESGTEGIRLSHDAELVLNLACGEALSAKHTYISTYHLLLGLAFDASIKERFPEIDGEKIKLLGLNRRVLRPKIHTEISPKYWMNLSEMTRDVIKRASTNVHEAKRDEILPLDILTAIVRTPDSVGAKILNDLGIELKKTTSSPVKGI